MSLRSKTTKINGLKKSIKECVDNLACYCKDYLSPTGSKEQLKSLILTRSIDINLFVSDLVACALKPEEEKKEQPKKEEEEEELEEDKKDEK